MISRRDAIRIGAGAGAALLLDGVVSLEAQAQGARSSRNPFARRVNGCL